MSKTVAVTGATGYLAGYVIKQLLERGYTVHGTVRSLDDKQKHAHLTSLPNADTHLKLFKADLLESGSFTEAVKGCSIVFHVASPYIIFGIEDPQKQLVEPALQGTLNVLEAAHKSGTVKRVVLTSSTAAVAGNDTIAQGVVHTEATWNNWATIQNSPYPYSKVQAEKCAWKFHEKDEPFELTVVNPPLIIGPALQDYTDFNQLNTSNKRIAQIAQAIKNGNEYDNSYLAGMGISDVRDVAKAHILLGEAKQTNQRFLCVPGSYTWKYLAEAMVKRCPQVFGENAQVKMKSEGGKIMQCNSDKIHQAISIQFTDIEDTVADTVDYLAKHNFI